MWNSDGGVLCVRQEGRVCNGWSLCFIASDSLSRYLYFSTLHHQPRLSSSGEKWRKTCEPGWQFGKWLLLLCFPSCFISCLGGFPVILTTTCELQSSDNLWYKYIYKFNNSVPTYIQIYMATWGVCRDCCLLQTQSTSSYWSWHRGCCPLLSLWIQYPAF